MTNHCPECGESIDERDSFCPECGEPLDGTQQRARSNSDGNSDDGEGQNHLPAGGRGDVSSEPIPRKGAVDTFAASLRWLLGLPALFGAFLLVDVIGILGGVSAVFSLAGFLLGLVVWGVAYSYTERLVAGAAVEGSVAELLDIAREVLGSLLRLVGIFVVYVVLVGVGLLLLVLPGIYLGARLVLAFPACVLDDRSVIGSFSTSWEVADGNLLKLLGVFLVSILALFVVDASLLALTLVGTGTFALDPVWVDTVGTWAFLGVTVPVTAFVGGVVQLSVARIYLENRTDDSGSEP